MGLYHQRSYAISFKNDLMLKIFFYSYTKGKNLKKKIYLHITSCNNCHTTK